jgi:hypothetical protein
MHSVSARLLMIWLLCVLAGTLAPFSFATGVGLEHGLKVFEYGAFERDPIHFSLNLLLFMPLGMLLHREGRRRSVTLLPIVILVGIAGISISTTVEFFQAFLPTRNSSLIDVVADAVGALVGMAADRRWGASAEARVAQVRAATSSAMLAGLLGSFLVVTLLISGTLQARTRLSNWNPAYPLLIGNEHTGDRPWRGRLFALDITDAATPVALVRRFSAGESVAFPGARIATFVFNGSPPYKDASGNLPDLEWRERPDARGQGGVWLAGGAWLQTGRPATGLAERLRKTNAFTMRLECATDDTNQDGPARIISNSVSPFLRNFTLGQRGSDLVFRLRTPDTGVNGHPLEVHVPGIFADHRPRELLVTYDGATLLVAMARSDDVSSTALTPGVSVALAVPALHVHPGDLQMYEMGYVAALSVIPGALICLLGHTGRQRRAFSVAWVLVSAVLLEVTIVRVSGRFFDWGDVIQAGGVGAAVLVVCNALSSSDDISRRRPARAGAPNRSARSSIATPSRTILRAWCRSSIRCCRTRRSGTRSPSAPKSRTG